MAFFIKKQKIIIKIFNFLFLNLIFFLNYPLFTYPKNHTPFLLKTGKPLIISPSIVKLELPGQVIDSITLHDLKTSFTLSKKNDDFFNTYWYPSGDFKLTINQNTHQPFLIKLPLKKYNLLILTTPPQGETNFTYHQQFLQLANQLVSLFLKNKKILEYDLYTFTGKYVQKNRFLSNFKKINHQQFTFYFFMGNILLKENKQWVYNLPQNQEIVLEKFSLINPFLSHTFLIDINKKPLSQIQNLKLPFNYTYLTPKQINSFMKSFVDFYTQTPFEKLSSNYTNLTLQTLLQKIKAHHIFAFETKKVILREFQWQKKTLQTNFILKNVYTYQTNSLNKIPKKLTKNFITYKIKMKPTIKKIKKIKKITNISTKTGYWKEKL